MKKIKKRFMLITLLSGLGFIISILFCLLLVILYKLNIKISLIIAGSFLCFFIVLFIFEYKKYILSKLIIDNEILHLQPVQFKYDTLLEKERKLSNVNIDIFISCFGILIDGKIFKFNINKIILKKIEIDSKYIWFTYGDGELRAIGILYGSMKKEERQEFIEKFSHETGVVPILKN